MPIDLVSSQQLPSTVLIQQKGVDPSKRVITLVHGADRHSLPKRDQWNDLDRCDASESLVDVLLGDRSIAEVGAALPDPVRIIDMYVLERLIRVSRWNIPIPLFRLVDTLLDDGRFVFASELRRRGYDKVTADMVRNAIKRIRGALSVAFGVAPHSIVHFERFHGYLFRCSDCAVEVLHLPH